MICLFKYIFCWFPTFGYIILPVQRFALTTVDLLPLERLSYVGP